MYNQNIFLIKKKREMFVLFTIRAVFSIVGNILKSVLMKMIKIQTRVTFPFHSF